ncbi:MAG: cytochrome c [Gammaproteobacteria bacterium]|nr:MAG: cytochrome c [Gammaproteobacteria bacterium]
MTANWSDPRTVPRARPRAARLAGLLVLAGTPGLMSAQVPESDPSRQLFDTVCVACHTIGGGVRIGPDLAGVTERRSADWLRNFIRDPEQMRKSGDLVATANLAQYGVPMPNLGLTEAQVEGLIQHLGGARAAAPVRPRQHLPTLALAVLVAGGFTWAALTFGRKRVEKRA